MLAGDDAGEVRLLEAALTAAGHQVHRASGADQIAAHAVSAGPDIILIDRTVSGESGLDVCRRLRRTGQPAGRAHVLLIGDDHTADGLDAGADGCLSRPVAERDLLAHVRAALRRRDEARPSGVASDPPGDARLRQVVDSALDCIISIDGQGCIVEFNPAAERTFGFRREDVMGRRLSETIVPPPLRAAHEAGLERYMRSRVGTVAGQRLEMPALCADGRNILVELTIAPIGEASPTIFTAFLRDITERRRVETQLRESEARFRELAETLQDVFYVVESKRVTYVNAAYEKVFRRSRESLYADPRSVLESVHPDDRAIRNAAYLRQLAGEATDNELRILWPDGTVRWVRAQSYALAQSAEGAPRLVGVVRDITEAKIAGDRLAQQAALLDLARDAIIVRDMDHRITYWNASAERLYGWTAAEVLGRSSLELHARPSHEFAAAFDQVQRDGEWVGVTRQQTRSGEPLLVESRWTLVRDAEGRPASVLVINTDITTQTILEHQFLRAQRLESIGVLAGGIAHDLNNVLTPIILGAEMLAERATDAADRKLLATLLGSARRGRDMVTQVLTFARGAEAARFAIKPAVLVKGVVTIARDTFPKHIHIRTDITPEPWTVVGDETQMHQVLLNLCVNARDAMATEGTLRIAVDNVRVDAAGASRHPAVPAGLYVVFTVADTGSGMDAAVLDRIFDPFFTTKGVGEGTGLGLSTSMTIVKNHGGAISVRSAPGAGSEFLVYLPAQTGADRAAEPNERPRGFGETILVVDDEAMIREVADLTLRGQGYNTLLAADGAQAVALYRQHRDTIAAVVTDMMMPVMDGRSTITALRALDPHVRIIAASGIPLGDDVDIAGGEILEFLPKPYSADALLGALRRALDPPA